MADAGRSSESWPTSSTTRCATPPDDPVRIGAARVGDRMTITVADTGPGMPAAPRIRVFDAFQRLGDRDNTVGVGLGLSVVAGFVEAMGGTVECDGHAGRRADHGGRPGRRPGDRGVGR